MLRGKRRLIPALMIGLLSLTAAPAFARSISFKDAGIAMWIFLIIGAIIILLQLIPAAILFFSFIGTTTGLIARRKEATKEEEVKTTLPGYEAASVKK